MNIAVLGAGSWGTTLAVLLAKKGYQVRLWAHRPEFAAKLEAERENRRYLKGVHFPETLLVVSRLRDLVAWSQMIVTAVPSQALRETLLGFSDIALDGKILVNVAKGIEIGTGKRMSEVLLEVLPGLRASQVVALYGPSHAEEVSKEQPTTVVASSPSLATAKKVQDIFHTSMFHVYVNTISSGLKSRVQSKTLLPLPQVFRTV